TDALPPPAAGASSVVMQRRELANFAADGLIDDGLIDDGALAGPGLVAGWATEDVPDRLLDNDESIEVRFPPGVGRVQPGGGVVIPTSGNLRLDWVMDGNREFVRLVPPGPVTLPSGSAPTTDLVRHVTD